MLSEEKKESETDLMVGEIIRKKITFHKSISHSFDY